MPRVPRLDGPQVQEINTPSVRYNQNPSAEVFGGGQSQARLQSAIQGTLQKVKQDADEIAVLEAQNKLYEWESTSLYDKDKGALNKLGKDSLEASNAAISDFDKVTSEIESKLSTGTQKSMFARMRTSKYQEVNRLLQRHTSNEMGKYDNEQTKYSIIKEQESALRNFGDDALVGLSVSRQHEVLDQFARRNGKPQEWLDIEKQKAASKTYSSIIGKALDSDAATADKTALFLYEKYKDFLSPEDAEVVGKQIEKVTVDKEGMRFADLVFDKNKYSQSKAFEEIRKIENEEVRKAARSYLGQLYSDYEGAKREDEKTLYKNLYNRISQNKGDLTKIGSLMASLDPEKQEALRKFAEGERTGSNRNKVSDDKTYYKLIEMTKTEKGFSEFEKLNLLDPGFVNTLSQKDLNMFLKKQQGGFNSNDSALDRSMMSTVDMIYRENGFKVPDKKAAPSTIAEYNQFLSALKEQVSAEEATTPQKIEEISRRLLKKRVLNSRSYWFDYNTPVFKADPKSVDISDIDSTTIKAFESALERKGRPVTEENLKALYIEALKAGRI